MDLEYKIYSATGNVLAITEKVFPRESIVDFCLKYSLDGILCLSECFSADVFMRIFNSDGSEAEMCGNGLRVAVQYLFSKTNKISYNIATLSGIYKGYVDKEAIVVDMARSSWNFHKDICVTYENKEYFCHFINTGVPHAVIFVEDMHIDVQKLGAAIRFSKVFSPEGVNVDFVFRMENSLFVRTYERGVERETGACGTGATAAALIASKIYGLSSPIKILTTFQEYLTISFNDFWSEVLVGGKVNLIKEGTFCLNTDVINC